MSEARVIKATFADWRTVKTRKVLQIVLELPLEQQGEVLSRLGAPMPDQEKWVAVALLDELVASETERAPDQDKEMLERAAAYANKEKDPSRSAAGKWRYINSDEMTKALTRAVLLPKDPRFQTWTNCRTEEAAAAFIRRACAIKTRSAIAADMEAYERYLDLEQQFAADTGRMAEARG